jgi:hypothetical protein
MLSLIARFPKSLHVLCDNFGVAESLTSKSCKHKQIYIHILADCYKEHCVNVMLSLLHTGNTEC